jgi:hypothetical protein
MTTSTQPTCGELYLQALEHYTGFNDAKIALFAPGFILGQSEKVASGAARACMFRPSVQYHSIVEEACKYAMMLYGDLTLLFIGGAGEYWLYRTAWHDLMMEIYTLAEEDKDLWKQERWARYHYLRARMCGISDIDTQYHLRSRYNVQCDTKET